MTWPAALPPARGWATVELDTNMSYFDESDARRDARRDHDRGRCDREMYDRHSWDARKEAYTEEWNAAKREEERRQERLEEEREQERREEAARERRRHEAEMERRQEEEEHYRQQQEAYEQQQSEPTPEPPVSESPNDKISGHTVANQKP